jgi:hypothetical protein
VTTLLKLSFKELGACTIVTVVLINSPTCFGFQVPSSGGYSFLIYKVLQVVCVSGRRGLLFPWCGHLLRISFT